MVIPFANLNLIFASGVFFIGVIRLIEKTQIGIPYLLISSVIMLLCLLFSNSEAKTHFKRKSAVFRWLYALLNRTKTSQPTISAEEPQLPRNNDIEMDKMDIPKPIYILTSTPILIPRPNSVVTDTWQLPNMATIQFCES